MVKKMVKIKILKNSTTVSLPLKFFLVKGSLDQFNQVVLLAQALPKAYKEKRT